MSAERQALLEAPVAIASSYEGIVQACVLRRHELGLSQTAVDEISGMQDGYTAKLEVGIKRLGAMSLPTLLQTLGLELVVVRVQPHHERQRRLPPSSSRGRSMAGSERSGDRLAS